MIKRWCGLSVPMLLSGLAFGGWTHWKMVRGPLREAHHLRAEARSMEATRSDLIVARRMEELKSAQTGLETRIPSNAGVADVVPGFLGLKILRPQGIATKPLGKEIIVAALQPGDAPAIGGEDRGGVGAARGGRGQVAWPRLALNRDRGGEGECDENGKKAGALRDGGKGRNHVAQRAARPRRRQPTRPRTRPRPKR